MVFMGRGFTFGGQESGSVFSAAVCKIQASKHYVESLPLVLKKKRSCFSQGERFAKNLSRATKQCCYNHSNARLFPPPVFTC